MNNHTVLQMRHVMIQTRATREGMEGRPAYHAVLKSHPMQRLISALAFSIEAA
jgi:hypothetical protein